jgi:hypothetical protein
MFDRRNDWCGEALRRDTSDCLRGSFHAQDSFTSSYHPNIEWPWLARKSWRRRSAIIRIAKQQQYKPNKKAVHALSGMDFSGTA